MTTKEKIKKRIDLLPDELVEQVQKYLDSIKTQQRPKKRIRTLHLKGQYDNLNVSGPNNSNAQTWKISLRKFENYELIILYISYICCKFSKRSTTDTKIEN